MSTLVLYSTWTDRESAKLLALRTFLPAAHRARYHENEHSRAASAAYALLHIALTLRCPEYITPSFSYTGNGKPVLEMNNQAIHFNISHTTGLALCALSDAPVGVDGEHLRRIPPQRSTRLALPDTPREFFMQWVRRESIIKLRGGSALECRRNVPLRPRERYIPLNVGDAHAAGLCTHEHTKPELRKIELNELLTLLTKENFTTERTFSVTQR